MTRVKRFFFEIDIAIQNSVDVHIALHHESIPHLIMLDILAIILIITSGACDFIVISYPWLNLLDSYPWYMLPAVIFSPYIIWRSVHMIKSTNYHLTQF